MKFIKPLLILSTLFLTSISFGQKGDVGKSRTLKFTKQVDNKFVEIVFQAQPGDYLGGETYFKFKLEQIIVHQWEIDGELYTSSNSQGILPANGKLGHVYLDVKVKTINNQFNEFWVKEGFQMNNMTDFQDIEYDGRTENKWWINYAHVSDVNINSVHFSNWFEIEKQLKALESNNTASNTNSNNQSSNNNTTVASNQNNTSNTSSQVQQVAKEMNLREDELKILEVISNTDNLNNALAKLNELGYQNFNKYTIDALNKLSTSIPDFPLTGNEMNTLLNGGTFKDIQKSYNLRQSTKIAQKLGLNSSQTELLNIISTSENNEDLNQRIKAKNIRDISNLSQNALNKILGENNTIFPATSSDITDMINGNWEQALTNINNEIQVRNTMRNTGFDRETAEGINALGTAIGQTIRQNQENKEKELIDNQKKLIKDFLNEMKLTDQTKEINKHFKKEVHLNKNNIAYNLNAFQTIDRNENTVIKLDDSFVISKNERLKILEVKNDEFNAANDFEIELSLGFSAKNIYKNKGKKPHLLLTVSDYKFDFTEIWRTYSSLNFGNDFIEKYFLRRITLPNPDWYHLGSIGKKYRLKKLDDVYVKYYNRSQEVVSKPSDITLKHYNNGSFQDSRLIKKELKKIKKSTKQAKNMDYMYLDVKILSKNGKINYIEEIKFKDLIITKVINNFPMHSFQKNNIILESIGLNKNDEITVNKFNINQ